MVLPVDVLIMALLLFLWCWDYPPDQPVKKFVSKFSFPFLYIGLWHGWALFAPNPIHLNRWLRASVTFADGTTTDWELLNPERSRLVNTLYVRHFKFQHHCFVEGIHTCTGHSVSTSVNGLLRMGALCRR